RAELVAELAEPLHVREQPLPRAARANRLVRVAVGALDREPDRRDAASEQHPRLALVQQLPVRADPRPQALLGRVAEHLAELRVEDRLAVGVQADAPDAA